MNKDQEKYIPLALGVAALVFQLVTPNVLGFHRDELLYFSMADHPAIGYYSVPPFTGLMAFISANIFGYSLFAAKILPAIAGGILAFFIALTARELKGGVYAQILAVVTFVSSLLFIRAFNLFQPVPFDILFWTILMYLFLKFINSRDPDILISFGIVTGLAILNKYNILFLLAGIIIPLLFSKYRKVIYSRHFLLAGGIALLIVSPNIIWQFTHGLPVIGHMAELRRSQLVNMQPVTFLSEQLLMIMPGSIVIFPGLIWILLTRKMKEYRIMGFVCIVVLALFLLLQGKSYYSAGIYPFLAAAGATFFSRLLQKNYQRILLILLLVVQAYFMFPMGKPVLPPDKLVAYFDTMASVIGNDAVRRDEDNNYNRLPQDYADMLGWDELAFITAKAWKECDPDSSFIYCENYGQAGAITILGKKYGLPTPVSFSESFIYWAPKDFRNEITSFIYINHEMGDDVQQLFSDIRIVGAISNPLARERGAKVYLCQKPTTSFNRFYRTAVNR